MNDYKLNDAELLTLLQAVNDYDDTWKSWKEFKPAARIHVGDIVQKELDKTENCDKIVDGIIAKLQESGRNGSK